MSKEIDRVIFRRWRTDNKTVIAIFPRIIGTNSPHSCEMYEHVGQHGAGDPQGVIQATKPVSVKDPEVKALMKELKGRGYNLQVFKRHTQADLQDRKNQLATTR